MMKIQNSCPIRRCVLDKKSKVPIVTIYQLVLSVSLFLPLKSPLFSLLQSHLPFSLTFSLSLKFPLHTFYENSQNIFYCIRLFANSRSLPLSSSPFFRPLALLCSFTPYVAQLCNCRCALLGSVFVIYQLQMWELEMGKKAQTLA